MKTLAISTGMPLLYFSILHFKCSIQMYKTSQCKLSVTKTVVVIQYQSLRGGGGGCVTLVHKDTSRAGERKRLSLVGVDPRLKWSII